MEVTLSGQEIVVYTVLYRLNQRYITACLSLDRFWRALAVPPFTVFMLN